MKKADLEEIESKFYTIVMIAVLAILPLLVVDHYFDFTGRQAAEQARQQARIEHIQETQARKHAFDDQLANESGWDATKRRLRFWGHMENEAERLTK